MLLHLFQSSPTPLAVPRSSHGVSSSSSAMSDLSGLPIRHVQGVVEHHIVHEENPALLTSVFDLRTLVLRHLVGTLEVNNTLVNTESAKKEKEIIVAIPSQRNIGLSISKTVAVDTADRSTAQPFHSFTSNRRQEADSFNHVHQHLRSPSQSSLGLSFSSSAGNMTTVASSPGSPPDLSISHSSKSSVSSHASYIQTPEDFSGGSMNFEDINLEDDRHSSGSERGYPKYSNKENSNRHAKRPSLATIQTQPERYLRSVENGIKSAAAASSKRAFSSPIASDPTSLQSRTRSESPTLHRTLSAARLGQYAQTPATSLAVPKKRGSYSSRKTVYEIEAEYHESDDELPDDASLFNVPISPFSPWPRSAKSSTRSSPERGSVSPSPIPLGHARTAPDTPPKSSRSVRVASRQQFPPRSSSTLHVSGSFPPRKGLRAVRTKSWNLVIADLDHEARIVAEKLDFHAEVNAKHAWNTTANRSSAPGAIPLPPIQRGTLDFMPMSKEKEAVLSRTRPSWLPPKDPREEKKHLEEYKQMMKASIEAEKRRESRQKQEEFANDTKRDSLHRVWTYYVEPTTDVTSIDRRVNNLCWRGIPPRLRGAVWQRAIGNPLGLSEKSYELARGKIDSVKSKSSADLTEHDKKMMGWFADIDRDAETAFPELSMFRRHTPQWQDLVNLCESYACYREDTGYVYGLQLVAALVLLQLPNVAEAFVFLGNCLNKSVPHAFQSSDQAGTSRTYSKVKSTLEIKFPRLYSYLFDSLDQGGLEFTGEELFSPMFQTLFSNGLDLDRLCRVWDIWIFESDRYLIRTAVALLGTLQNQIMDVGGDVSLRKRNIQEMLGWGPFNRTSGGYWNLSTLGDEEWFVEEIRAAGKLDCAGR